MRTIGLGLFGLFIVSAIYSLATGVFVPFWWPIAQGLGNLFLFLLRHGWWLVLGFVAGAVIHTLRVMNCDPPACYRGGPTPASQTWGHYCKKCSAPIEDPGYDTCARCGRRYDYLGCRR